MDVCVCVFLNWYEVSVSVSVYADIKRIDRKDLFLFIYSILFPVLIVTHLRSHLEYHPLGSLNELPESIGKEAVNS